MSHVIDYQLTILKRDARGRVRSSAEARAEAVAECRRSGLSASCFCQNDGHLQEHFWELAAMPWVDAKARPLALEVQQPPAGALCAGDGAGGICPGFVVRLPGGATVELADERQAVLAARLVQSLA